MLIFLGLLTLSSLASTEALAETSFYWHGSDPSCVVKKLNGQAWTQVDARGMNVTPANVQRIAPADSKSSVVRFYTAGSWYASTPSCFSGIQVGQPSVGAAAKPAQSGQSELEFTAGYEYRGESRLISSTFAGYTLNAVVSELELGIGYLKPTSAKAFWGLDFGVGIGFANITSASTAITYRIQNQMLWSTRLLTGFHRSFSPRMIGGLEAGLIYSSMSLPAPASSTGLSTPTSGIIMGVAQAKLKYRFGQKFSMNFTAGANQFKNLKAGLDLVFRL